MRRVIVIEPVLAHYRRDLYKYLLDCKDFQFEIIAGSEYQGIESLEAHDSFHTFSYFSFKFFKHYFYFLKGCIRYVFSRKPFLILCKGADFHQIHTIILFILYRIILRREFYWWTHATTGKQGRFGVAIRRMIYRAASGNLVYSKKGLDTFVSLGVTQSNVHIISNAFNREDYGYLNRELSASNSQDGTLRILFSGRIFKERKLEILIHAISLLINKYGIIVMCSIVGGGEVKELKKLSQELDIEEAVQFPGAKYGKDVYNYFDATDLLVYPGPIGLALLHAYSFGVPAITSDNLEEQMPEIELLSPGLTGDFYKENSPEDLAEKILYWRKKISESRDSIREDCIQRIEKLGYLPDRVGDSIVGYLKNRYPD